MQAMKTANRRTVTMQRDTTIAVVPGCFLHARQSPGVQLNQKLLLFGVQCVRRLRFRQFLAPQEDLGARGVANSSIWLRRSHGM
jgi:hypothetical protein